MQNTAELSSNFQKTGKINKEILNKEGPLSLSLCNCNSSSSLEEQNYIAFLSLLAVL